MSIPMRAMKQSTGDLLPGIGRGRICPTDRPQCSMSQDPAADPPTQGTVITTTPERAICWRCAFATAARQAASSRGSAKLSVAAPGALPCTRIRRARSLQGLKAGLKTHLFTPARYCSAACSDTKSRRCMRRWTPGALPAVGCSSCCRGKCRDRGEGCCYLA